MLEDAKKLAKKHGRPFIAGLGKENGMIVSPMSDRSKFVAPLSCVVAKSGFWSVSDMHADRVQDPLFMLYDGIAYGRKRYGRLEAGRNRSVLNLESAFEDATSMPRYHDGVPYCVMPRDGFICVQSKAGHAQSHRSDAFLEVDPGEFLDGGVPLRERISAAAKAAYGKFSQIGRNA